MHKRQHCFEDESKITCTFSGNSRHACFFQGNWWQREGRGLKTNAEMLRGGGAAFNQSEDCADLRNVCHHLHCRQVWPHRRSPAKPQNRLIQHVNMLRSYWQHFKSRLKRGWWRMLFLKHVKHVTERMFWSDILFAGSTDWILTHICSRMWVFRRRRIDLSWETKCLCHAASY